MKDILASLRKIKGKKNCRNAWLSVSVLTLGANKLSASREKQTKKYSQRTNTSIFSSCREEKRCNLVEIPMRILLLCLILL